MLRLSIPQACLIHAQEHADKSKAGKKKILPLALRAAQPAARSRAVLSENKPIFFVA